MPLWQGLCFLALWRRAFSFSPEVSNFLSKSNCGVEFLSCWSEEFTFETCCDRRYGYTGDLNCWDLSHDFNKCCKLDMSLFDCASAFLPSLNATLATATAGSVGGVYGLFALYPALIRPTPGTTASEYISAALQFGEIAQLLSQVSLAVSAFESVLDHSLDARRSWVQAVQQGLLAGINNEEIFKFDSLADKLLVAFAGLQLKPANELGPATAHSRRTHDLAALQSSTDALPVYYRFNPFVFGAANLAELKFLGALVQLLRPEFILEVGFFLGDTAKALLAASREYGAIVHSFDPAVGPCRAGNVLAAAETDRFRFSCASGLHASAELANASVDFLFFDTAHELEQDLLMWQALEPLLKRDAVAVVHDSGSWSNAWLLRQRALGRRLTNLPRLARRKGSRWITADQEDTHAFILKLQKHGWSTWDMHTSATSWGNGFTLLRRR